ncbi:hypothetical protein KR093_004591 [Drosophila rubida]|uniref:Uncharacterized protein n=1 Tax=Drosophila rubida TaxID=30044 RepID=A0AAD4JSY0_9MUSC|nr:hypothetical protein KR093_004591 [Drosophila rubida]
MKIYPNADAWFYVEKPGCWGSYQRYGPYHSWKLPDREYTPRYMHYWRDIEGQKLRDVKRKDLYFENWPKSRIRAQACLGMLYATGYRFIRISRAPPAGFKCAPLPVNLATAQYVKAHLKKKKKEAKGEQNRKKKEAAAKKKAELAHKNRGAPRGRN